MNTDAMRPEVQEVIDFAMGCRFFFAGEPREGLDVEVVSEIPEDFAHAGPGGKRYQDLEADEWTYQGIREDQMAAFLAALSEDSRKKKEAAPVWRLLMGKGRLADDIWATLPSTIDPDGIVADFILGDMICCAQDRVAFGKREGYWNTVFEIYKSGGIPVGWSGKYPQGRLMAIYPAL